MLTEQGSYNGPIETAIKWRVCLFVLMYFHRWDNFHDDDVVWKMSLSRILLVDFMLKGNENEFDLTDNSENIIAIVLTLLYGNADVPSKR